MITISQLTIYPIKACGGVNLTDARLVPGGLLGDRRYMLVDEAGLMITRRKEARLAQVEIRTESAAFIVSAPRCSTLSVAWNGEEAATSRDIHSTVWRDTVVAQRHENGSSWFSSFLGKQVHLVYMPDASLRQLNADRSDREDVVSFADGYPLLVTSESSLADLNTRLDTPIGMERFRPNVIVTGAAPFEEDTWAEIQLGDVGCVLPKLCDRCVVTTITEGTSERSREPLKTLATFRRWDGAVWFGANAVHQETGTLRIGQPVKIKSLRPHPAGETR